MIDTPKARVLSSFRVVSPKPLNALQQKTGGRLGDGVDKDEIRPYFPISLNEVIVCIVSGSRNTTENFSTLMTAVKFLLNICYQAYYLCLALYSLLFYKPFLIENFHWTFDADEHTVFSKHSNSDLCLVNRTIAGCNILISGLILENFPM